MADRELTKKLDKASLETKLRLLDLCHQTLIHIGGDLSVCDMMTAIWQYAMTYDVENPRWEGRDRFILSKGHAAAVTSFSQAAIGCYEFDDIYNEYATDFGRFGMHSCNLANPYVDVSTGSLGHGMPIAGGIAAALKRKGSTSRVYCVVGDGECGEGSIWEAALFANHYKLGNLAVFVDRNGLSFDGPTEEYMALEPLADKWRSFGWNVKEIDGHDMAQIIDAIDELPSVDSDKPTVIIGKTKKGNGVSFMEQNVAWHAGSVNDDDWKKAKDELITAYEEKWGEKL
ncbi:MAG TPA: transketolase [Clostridiaceae bacterium]|nr:transketolase [Clostridiaceae bacterium]